MSINIVSGPLKGCFVVFLSRKMPGRGKRFPEFVMEMKGFELRNIFFLRCPYFPDLTLSDHHLFNTLGKYIFCVLTVMLITVVIYSYAANSVWFLLEENHSHCIPHRNVLHKAEHRGPCKSKTTEKRHSSNVGINKINR